MLKCCKTMGKRMQCQSNQCQTFCFVSTYSLAGDGKEAKEAKEAPAVSVRGPGSTVGWYWLLWRTASLANCTYFLWLSFWRSKFDKTNSKPYLDHRWKFLCRILSRKFQKARALGVTPWLRTVISTHRAIVVQQLDMASHNMGLVQTTLFGSDVEGAACFDREGPLHLCRGIEAPSDGGVATMKGFGMVVVTKSPSVTAWELSMGFWNSHPSGFGLITLFSQKVSVPCFALHPQFFSKNDSGPEGESNFNKSYWNQHEFYSGDDEEELAPLPVETVVGVPVRRFFLGLDGNQLEQKFLRWEKVNVNSQRLEKHPDLRILDMRLPYAISVYPVYNMYHVLPTKSSVTSQEPAEHQFKVPAPEEIEVRCHGVA